MNKKNKDSDINELEYTHHLMEEYMYRNTTKDKIYFSGKELAKNVLKSTPKTLNRDIKYISLAVRELGYYRIVNIKGLGYVYLDMVKAYASDDDKNIILDNLKIQLKRKKEFVKLLKQQIKELDFD